MVSAKISLALFAASCVVAQSIAGDASVVAHTGTPVGKEMKYENGMYSLTSKS
jgi:hypothetical protein